MREPALTQSPRLEQLFGEQAAATPDAPAIFFRDQVVGYGELGSLIESFAAEGSVS